MATPRSNSTEAEWQPAVTIPVAIAALSVFILTALATVYLLPGAVPALTQSMVGDQPKAFWYLSRTSAFVAFVQLWLSMVTGLLISNQLALVWHGGPTMFDLHRYTSLLSLGFVLFHALILLGDQYIKYTLVQIAMPFTGNFKPLWVGVGQCTF